MVAPAGSASTIAWSAGVKSLNVHSTSPWPSPCEKSSKPTLKVPTRLVLVVTEVPIVVVDNAPGVTPTA